MRLRRRWRWRWHWMDDDDDKEREMEENDDDNRKIERRTDDHNNDDKRGVPQITDGNGGTSAYLNNYFKFILKLQYSFLIVVLLSSSISLSLSCHCPISSLSLIVVIDPSENCWLLNHCSLSSSFLSLSLVVVVIVVVIIAPSKNCWFLSCCLSSWPHPKNVDCWVAACRHRFFIQKLLIVELLLVVNAIVPSLLSLALPLSPLSSSSSPHPKVVDCWVAGCCSIVELLLNPRGGTIRGAWNSNTGKLEII